MPTIAILLWFKKLLYFCIFLTLWPKLSFNQHDMTSNTNINNDCIFNSQEASLPVNIPYVRFSPGIVKILTFQHLNIYIYGVDSVEDRIYWLQMGMKFVKSQGYSYLNVVSSYKRAIVHWSLRCRSAGIVLKPKKSPVNMCRKGLIPPDTSVTSLTPGNPLVPSP